jgi:hypothetical protein
MIFIKEKILIFKVKKHCYSSIIWAENLRVIVSAIVDVNYFSIFSCLGRE